MTHAEKMESLEAEIVELRKCLKEWQRAYKALAERMADALYRQNVRAGSLPTIPNEIICEGTRAP